MQPPKKSVKCGCCDNEYIEDISCRRGCHRNCILCAVYVVHNNLVNFRSNKEYDAQSECKTGLLVKAGKQREFMCSCGPTSTATVWTLWQGATGESC